MPCDMAWLLRRVVVLIARAAGSAENVIDMKATAFNPLTLCAPYRLLHIASTVNADVLLLQGTGLRCSCDSRYTSWDFSPDFWVISLGWKQGPLTNSSAGCAIVLRRRWFSRDDVKKVCFPLDALAGRGGAIRVVSGDFLFGCQYTPPISGTKGKMQASVKAASQLSKWAQETLSAVLARSLIVWGGDFNSGFGLHQDGTRWDKGVGDANLKCPKPGSASWYDWLQVNDMASFFHHSGSSSLVEHVITSANVASNATARINWKVARVLQHIPSKEVRDHVPIFFYLHCNWYGSWKSIQVEREQWDYDKLAACLQHGTEGQARETSEPESVHLRPVADVDGDAEARAANRAVLKGVPRHPVRCLLGPCRYSLRSLGIDARQAVCSSSSCICVRCFGILDLSARFCHKCGHPELVAVPDTFHGRETGAHKNVSDCEALRSQDEEAGNVFWGWARSTSAQIKAAASFESSGGQDLEGRAPPCRKPGEAPVLLGGRDGVGLATFSRTELLVLRGTAVRNSDGAAPCKFAGSIIHTVASAVSDPSIIWKMNWKLSSNSKYVEKHFRYS